MICWHKWHVKDTVENRLIWYLDYNKEGKCRFPLTVLLVYTLCVLVFSIVIAYFKCEIIPSPKLIIYAISMSLPSAICPMIVMLGAYDKVAHWFRIKDRVCIKCHKTEYRATEIKTLREKQKAEYLEQKRLESLAIEVADKIFESGKLHHD